MKFKFSCVAAMLLLSDQLHAQSPVFKVSGAAVFASSALDMATTRAGIKRGALEANVLLGQSARRQMALSFGAAGGMFFWTKSIQKEHPKTALAIRIGFIASRSLLALHNSGVRR